MQAGLGAGVSHNGFLEIYLNLGLIGLSLYVLFLAAAHANCKLWVRSDFSFGRFAYTLFVVTVLYHMTETPKGLSLILLMLYLVGLRASVHPVALGAARRVPAAGRGHSPALVFGRSDDG
jgi:O-antigen ligase